MIFAIVFGLLIGGCIAYTQQRSDACNGALVERIWPPGWACVYERPEPVGTDGPQFRQWLQCVDTVGIDACN